MIKKEYPSTKSGVHAIYINGSDQGKDVYCDMDTDGGGWTASIHRRRHLYSRGSPSCPIFVPGPAHNGKGCPIFSNRINIKSWPSDQVMAESWPSGPVMAESWPSGPVMAESCMAK